MPCGCPEGTPFDSEGHQKVCTGCGLVLEESFLTSESHYRENDESGNFRVRDSEANVDGATIRDRTEKRNQVMLVSRTFVCKC